MDIIFWDFLILNQIFFSAELKQSVIISDKHGIYELPHELPNNLRPRIMGNYEISGNCLNFMEWLPSSQALCQIQILLVLAENSRQTEIKYISK